MNPPRPIGQWGRDCSVAESREHRAEIVEHLQSFNGAATVQSRKGNVGDSIVWGEKASMGPRLFSRGKICASFGLGKTAMASMGPRLFSRGKWHVRHARGREPLASMGPRLFSRGKSRQHRSMLDNHRHGFNGAATVQSRKGWSNWINSSTHGSFNGAATVQSRKASRSSGSGPVSMSLQWGRDCSVAERCESRPRKRSTSRLQWGRDCSVAESQAPPTWKSRFGSCFNGAATVQSRKARQRCPSRLPHPPRFNGAATVQSRKGWYDSYGWHLTTELQWGRDCSVAESFAMDCPEVPRDRLQWGRDCSVAESWLDGW